MPSKPVRYAAKRFARFTWAGLMVSAAALIVYTAILMCVRGPEAYSSAAGGSYRTDRTAK